MNYFPRSGGINAGLLDRRAHACLLMSFDKSSKKGSLCRPSNGAGADLLEQGADAGLLIELLQVF
jgi:hypothetical protein